MNAIRFDGDFVRRAKHFDTPCLMIDHAVIAQNYQAIRANIAGARVYYAVKANYHPSVLGTLARLGCGFEIASSGELDLVLEHGVAARDIISSNPIKKPAFIARAHALGVDGFAVDSRDEILKLAALAPGCRVNCRVMVDNAGSDWPLSRKFGVPADDVLPLLRLARQHGLRPDGLTFHVGSQCRSAENWSGAIATCASIWRAAAAEGMRLGTLNLGGGLPVPHVKPIPSLDDIGGRISALLATSFPDDIHLAIEPGRAMVGSAAVLVTTVIGRSRRGDENWLYLDAGVFNGLMETIAGFAYELRTERTGPTRPFTLAGPSCDSVDVMFNRVELPDLEIGDRIYVLNAGAYTLSYASWFNGFDPPAVHAIPATVDASPVALAAGA